MISIAAQHQRCAIYTRKSASPPLGQEVTSLQSQRAICSSYIASQQHKGWAELPKSYEDAGRSGSTLDRPALQELLTDIEDGLVDVVLVYKMDRITRTLLDFVRLIDFFERFGVTFVAITQNFDTSDSMGRLIRNVLLTFAQFEREIASDRMRDKKMVMKQSGRWTGGTAPIGYDLHRRKLVVNTTEELAVKCIFETYVAEKRLAAVHKKLLAEGFRRRTWRSRTGAKMGGNAISLTSLHHVLQNPVYIGEVTHCGERYPGIHQPIIEKELFARAQEVLAERRLFKPRQPQHVLAGLLWDAYGRRMNARRGGYCKGVHRYYDSAPAAWAARRQLKILRIPASQIEALVKTSLQSLLCDPARLRVMFLDGSIIGNELDRMAVSARQAAVRLDNIKVAHVLSTYKHLISRIEIGFERVKILIRTAALAAYLRWDGVGLFKMSDAELLRAKHLHSIDIPIHLYRQRRETWLPVLPRGVCGRPDVSLVALLDDAREAQRMLYKERHLSMAELAWSLGKKPIHFSRLVKLNYLAPDIIASIMDGQQPAGLSRRELMKVDLPLDWALQRRVLGFPSITYAPAA